MKVINNFEIIENVIFKHLPEKRHGLTPQELDKVVFGRIIRRKKENPDKPDGYIVKRYMFKTLEQFRDTQEEIKELCKVFNARFYVSTNIKSLEEITFDMVEEIPIILRRKQYHLTRRLFESAADINRGIKESRLWILDIDDIKQNSQEFDELVEELLEHLDGNNIEAVIETVNGYHVLIKPQNLMWLDKDEELSRKIELKRNALTLAYYEPRETQETDAYNILGGIQNVL